MLKKNLTKKKEIENISKKEIMEIEEKIIKKQ